MNKLQSKGTRTTRLSLMNLVQVVKSNLNYRSIIGPISEIKVELENKILIEGPKYKFIGKPKMLNLELLHNKNKLKISFKNNGLQSTYKEKCDLSMIFIRSKLCRCKAGIFCNHQIFFLSCHHQNSACF